MSRKQIGGMGQARWLCQMSHKDQMAFLAEGLPIILDSAQGLMRAAQQLNTPREAEVLRGFADEEAAKILILMDAVRCPAELVRSKWGTIIKWFYDHLARLVYANAVALKLTNIAELREYIKSSIKSHYLDGFAGEFIMPNSFLYERERRLYADIEWYEDRGPQWSRPTALSGGISTRPLVLVEAMSALGMFTAKGLHATAETWRQVAFTDVENHADAECLTQMLFDRLILEGLPCDAAIDEHVHALFDHWQLPMYDFNLSRIDVSLEELKAEQDRMLWREVGDPW